MKREEVRTALALTSLESEEVRTVLAPPDATPAATAEQAHDLADQALDLTTRLVVGSYQSILNPAGTKPPDPPLQSAPPQRPSISAPAPDSPAGGNSLIPSILISPQKDAAAAPSGVWSRNAWRLSDAERMHALPRLPDLESLRDSDSVRRASFSTAVLSPAAAPSEKAEPRTPEVIRRRSAASTTQNPGSGAELAAAAIVAKRKDSLPDVAARVFPAAVEAERLAARWTESAAEALLSGVTSDCKLYKDALSGDVKPDEFAVQRAERDARHFHFVQSLITASALRGKPEE